MNSDLFLFSNYLPQTPPQPVVALLSPDDLQRIEYIQLLYHRRIELGKWHCRSLKDFLHLKFSP